MNRWKMHKLGFVNFWLYDQEEFPMEEGHILLRGENASGKSITTQSFIPFLLDGNKSPERLDPFGSRDRKMEFYLLGDGDREEATGYLYLELKKEQLEEYLTIGVGMRARRGKEMGFWGFCLCDGRRIGPQGISLTKKLGDQRIPLSKNELRNLIGDENNWADTPGTYKQLVNDRLFQFRDLRQYEQLIGLLIKVRTPKLSKDAFRPSAVKQVLNDSLQVLTDEDLSAMVSTMERMDELENTLESQRDAMRAAQIIQREYTRYNQYMLGKKAEGYLTAKAAAQAKEQDLAAARSAYEDAENAHFEAETEERDAQGKLRSLQAQRVALGEDDLAAQQGRLEEEQNTLRHDSRQLEQGKAQLADLARRIQERDAQLCRCISDREDLWQQVAALSQALEEENRSLLLEEAHRAYLHSLSTSQQEVEPQHLQAALSRRVELLQTLLQLTQQLEKQQEEYENACEALDRAETALRQHRSILRDAQQQEQQERDRLLEEIVRSQSENNQFRLPLEVRTDLMQRISRYHTPADWTSIARLLDTGYRSIQDILLGQKSRAQGELREANNKYRDALRTLREVQAQPEPIPPCRGERQAMRSYLTLSGIPHASLYEVVDFSPELDSDARERLEAQLTDAGLLDALVVPPEYQLQIQECLELYPDSFLSPEMPVKDPITALVPDGDMQFRQVVEAFLRGVSQSDWEEGTALLPDGRYRCGPIRGQSHSNGPAGYVGAAARRVNREKQLRLLEEKLHGAQQKVEEVEKTLADLDRQLSILAAERDATPNAADLDQAIEMLTQAQRALDEAQQEKTNCSQQEALRKSALARTEQKLGEASLGISYVRSQENYRRLLTVAEQYQRTLTGLTIQHNRWVDAGKQERILQGGLRETEEYAHNREEENRILAQRIAVSSSRIKTLEGILNSPEHRAKAKKRRELDEAIHREQQRKESAAQKMATQAERCRNLGRVIQQGAGALALETEKEGVAKEYFEEECALKLPNCPGEEGVAGAEAALAALRPEERERDSTRMNDALSKNYQAHRDALLNYQPKLEMVFDGSEYPELLRPRLLITLKKDGKELSLYDFICALQGDMDTCMMLMEEKDRDLFENILAETISHKLRARIEESEQWTRDMTKLMSTLNTSMGLTFRLDWKPRPAQGEEELDTARLVTLLSKDRALLTPEDHQRVSAHFRARVKKAREDAVVEDRSVGYGDLIRQVLDYRSWYEFHLLYRRDGESARELTDRAFNKFSGGEKAMAMYVPLFAAVSAQYQKGAPQCPRVMALDEAFAGVDERNISAMFHLLETLDFDYIMNSQALWGCYSEVTGLEIAELHRPLNASVVTILRYHWNGTRRIQEDL